MNKPYNTLPEDVVLSVSNVTKRFSLRANHSIKESIVNLLTPPSKKHETQNFTALSNVSFTIKRGETVGLIGMNGSGKSTMLKMLSGVMQPD